MTVGIESTSKSTNGNGSVTNFPYDFKIFKASDLTVIIRAANGTETVLTQTNPVQYTVTNVGVDTGGFAVISDTNLTPSGTKVICIRTAEFKQETDYTPNDPFPAADHENALDRLTMLSQQVNEKAERSIKLSRTNTMTSTEFTVGPTDRANKILAFDGNGELSVEAGKVVSASASASTVSVGGSATASAAYNVTTGNLALTLGIPTGATGAQGIQGIQGIQGFTHGLKYTFSATTTDADPGTGNFRLNGNSILTSNQLFIDNVDANGANATAFMDTWDDSANTDGIGEQGLLQIVSDVDTTVFYLVRITGTITTASTYRKVSFSLAASNGPITNGQSVRLHFTRTGKDATVSTGRALAMAYIFG